MFTKDEIDCPLAKIGFTENIKKRTSWLKQELGKNIKLLNIKNCNKISDENDLKTVIEQKCWNNKLDKKQGLGLEVYYLNKELFECFKNFEVKINNEKELEMEREKTKQLEILSKMKIWEENIIKYLDALILKNVDKNNNKKNNDEKMKEYVDEYLEKTENESDCVTWKELNDHYWRWFLENYKGQKYNSKNAKKMFEQSVFMFECKYIRMDKQVVLGWKNWKLNHKKYN